MWILKEFRGLAESVAVVEVDGLSPCSVRSTQQHTSARPGWKVDWGMPAGARKFGQLNHRVGMGKGEVEGDVGRHR
jgi:hypothetical protein